MAIHTRRNSLRYPGWDYSQPCSVFVTICTAYRQPLLGEVRSGEMILSAFGNRVHQRWLELPKRFLSITLDTFVVMPDHFHSIIHIGVIDSVQDQTGMGDVVRSFKVSTQNDFRNGLKSGAWGPYDRLLWQRGFHDRIVRSDLELATVRAYIDANPDRYSFNKDNDL